MRLKKSNASRNLFLFGSLSVGLIACSPTSDGGTSTSAGGSATSGVTTGGAVGQSSVTGTGGQPNTVAQGGRDSLGGATATGGIVATGGSNAIGGAATGGAVSTTGKATGGNATGGVGTIGKAIGGNATGGVGTTGKAIGGNATGGVGTTGKAIGGNATGGANTASKATGGSATSASATGGVGTTGKATGGSTSAGSSNGGAGGASPGCGSSNTTSTCSKSGTTCSVDIGGTPRTYYVQLPSGYSSSKQYPVIFQFHPMGGTAEQALTMYRISSGFPDAIYVTPQGLTANGNTGWANTNGQDIAFTKAMLADVQGKFCVDNSRIFSTGFSYGGMMSFAIGCEMGDVFRAIAPMSGALYSDFNCKGTGHAVAMWGSHGLSDTVVPIDDGRKALQKILQQNHCGTQTVPIDPSPCVAYQGCDAGYPVTWCEWDGPHNIPSFGSSAIVAFFKQF